MQGWLADHVARADPRAEVVRDELVGRCRKWRIEPPSDGRSSGSCAPRWCPRRTLEASVHSHSDVLGSKDPLGAIQEVRWQIHDAHNDYQTARGGGRGLRRRSP